MSYFKRVVKRRTACITEEEWQAMIAAGKLPRPESGIRDGRDYPPADVSDLVYQRMLSDLYWRVRVLWMAMLEPQVARSGNGSSCSSAKMGELLSQFVELWEFLSGTTYATGKPRLTGHLSLRLVSEGVQVTLTDPTSATYSTRVAASLDDALLSLEVALKDGTLKWHASSFDKRKK